MYLIGDRYFINSDRLRGELQSERYDLGYWRKHPNLHGFIVKTFADGVDACQEIGLSVEDIRSIIDAVRDRQLPETTGFFFGESDDRDEQIAEDTQILEEALKWLQAEELNVWKSVIYRASW
jgi:hypothetical protein